MEEEINWQLASNSQLEQECKRLQQEFDGKKESMKEAIDVIESLNEEIHTLSTKYNELKKILDKRQGKI